MAFGRYYLWPSAKSFFLTPLDVFAVYNEGKTAVDPLAQNWFHYSSARLRVGSATIQAKLLAPFPWICLLLNLGFLLVCGIYFCFPLRARSMPPLPGRHPGFTTSFKVAAAYLFANACFNIFASPSVFRYQVLPLILLFIFTIIGLFYVSFRGNIANDKLRCND